MGKPTQVPDDANGDGDGDWEFSTATKKKKKSTPATTNIRRTNPSSSVKTTKAKKAPGFSSSWTKPVVAKSPTDIDHSVNKDAAVTCEDGDDHDDDAAVDFHSRCRNQTLSSLLQEYGEYDPNWNKEIHPVTQGIVQKASDPTINRLAVRGKAPLHVEFVSFGYRYGIPADDPVLPFMTKTLWDSRCLNTVPSYLSWQDGLSGHVKRALMDIRPTNHDEEKKNNSNNNQISIQSFAREIAQEVAQSIEMAVKEFGYGYSMPLHLSILVGSELGRHRAVTTCELAATALRKILRENQGDRFDQPCSVGTRHRDIDRRVGNGAQDDNDDDN